MQTFQLLIRLQLQYLKRCHSQQVILGAMAALVDEDKMTHEDAAKKWLADNKSVWEPFTK